MRMSRRLVVALAAMLSFVPAVRAAEPQESEKVILDAGRSFWRLRTVWETEDIVFDSGEVRHVRVNFKTHNVLYKKQVADESDYAVEDVEVIRLPPETPGDWMKPAFDDSSWMRCHGPILHNSRNYNWKLVLMRGRFEVTDPAGVGALTLSAKFKGGLVVYLNGRELTRSHMPEGKVDVNTPAVRYPKDVLISPEGFLLTRYERGKWPQRFRKRIRDLSGFAIPPARLVKGVNVLALAIHRAPADIATILTRTKTYPENAYRSGDVPWARVGLIDVKLAAPAGASGISANVSRIPGKGFLCWNQSVLRRVFPSDYPDPFAPPAPVQLTGVRNGAFAGQVVVGHDRPIKGLKAEATDLTGPGTLPASAVQVRYALPDGPAPKRDQLGSFDSLEDFPPAEVPVYKDSGGALQPIWVAVRVPADAKPGDYAGRLTLTADGVEPIVVPLNLRVIDWVLPDPKAFTPRMDLVQSPESVAMAYDVPLWSDAHFKLLDRTFGLLSALSAKTLYITCIRRTHFGNEHAMVRWIRRADGSLDPDLTVVEKYLDVAARHLGKVPGVILYCWEPVESMGHAGGTGGAGRTHDRPILISLLDPRTGRLRKAKGPAWGSPESKAFWAKLTAGMKPILAKHGMGDSMLFGLIGDNRPTKQSMADISTGVAHSRWAVHSHHYSHEWNGYAIGMCSALWGIGCVPMDPALSRAYGWRNPFWLAYYPREMALSSPLVDHRTKLENWMAAVSRTYRYPNPDPNKHGTWGLGRIGADFWKVVKDRRGQPRATLAGRYPESYWGQLNLNYCIPHLLGRGRDGAVPTVRSEAFRENIQEIEARIFIEKALLDEAGKAGLGEDLARRCRAVLDNRIRMCLHSAGEGMTWFVSSDWNKRTEELFRLAAEVARKLGG